MRISKEDVEEYIKIVDREGYIEGLAYGVINKQIKLTKEELGEYYEEVHSKVYEIQLKMIGKVVGKKGLGDNVDDVHKSIGLLGKSITDELVNSISKGGGC